MTAEIRITIDPSSEGLAKLEKLVNRAERKADLLKNIGEALLETTKGRFDSQKDPQGAAWARLKPLTIAIRGNSGPILTVSGRLKGSLNYEVSGDTLKIGPSAIHGAVHQFGATITAGPGKMLAIPIGKANINRSRGGLILREATDKHPGRAMLAQKVTIPARPYVGFGAEDERAATETAQDWFDLDE